MAGSLTVPMPTSPALLRGHIFLLHGVYVGDVKEKEGLVDCHRTLHTEREFGSPIPHVHTANVSRTRGRRG